MFVKSISEVGSNATVMFELKTISDPSLVYSLMNTR